MATFNPDVPNPGDPSYLGLSRGISQPDADKTFATLFKGIGDAITIGAGAADQYVKTTIDNEVFSAVDAERSRYTQELQQKAGTEAAPGPAQARSGTDILTPEERENLPTDIKNIGSTLGNLKGAYDGGRISNTYYYGRLTSLAKSLRAKYPGYREYIDKEISSITGTNPANAYVTSLVSDINRAQAEAASAANRTESLIRQNIEVPGAHLILNGLRTGQVTTTQAEEWLNRNLSQKYALQLRKMQREDMKGSLEQQKIVAEDDAQATANQYAANYFDTVTLAAGLNTPAKIAEIIQKSQSGEQQITAEQASQLGAQLQAYKAKAHADLWKQFNERDASGRSLVQRLGGPDQARKIIEENLKIFDVVSDSIFNEKYGAAFSTTNFSKAKAADAKYGLLQDTSVGQYFTMQAAINDIGGPEFSKEFFTYFLKQDMDLKFKTFMETQAMKLTTQPDLRNSNSTSARPYTLSDAFLNASNKNVKDPKVFNGLVDHVAKIADPTTPDAVKLNLARAAFDPENRRFLSMINRDGIDPQTGKPVLGRYSVFNRLTSPSMTKEMRRLGNADPQVWQNYVNWAEESFGLELFNKEINDLREIQLQPDMKLGWDNENHQFTIRKEGMTNLNAMPLGNAARGFMAGNNQGFEEASRSINRLNSGLRSISNIAKETNSDVDAYLLELLIGMGFDPSKGDVTNIPTAMIDTIKRARVSDQLKKKSNANSDK